MRSTRDSTSLGENRGSRVEGGLVEMLVDLSGVDLSATDSATSFLELGFDSLFLTQAAQALQEKFGVKITFRQLLNDVSCLSALTEYVEHNLPPEVFAEPAGIEAHPEPARAAVAIAADPGAPAAAQSAPCETIADGAACEGSIALSLAQLI